MSVVIAGGTGLIAALLYPLLTEEQADRVCSQDPPGSETALRAASFRAAEWGWWPTGWECQYSRRAGGEQLVGTLDLGLWPAEMQRWPADEFDPL
ncbi:MAG: hypothetical protein ACRDOJ_11020 [Nocardioidaceae bacterium]